MQSTATPIENYLRELPQDRMIPMSELRKTILENIPEGFVEGMSYGMIGYSVPHSLYPKGYHVTPSLPLPFVNIASQKNFIALYHMALYGNPTLLKWFTAEYPKHSKTKLDMGKSCIRFKNPEHIPYKLIGELMQKMSVKDWITCYEKNLNLSK